MVRKELVLVNPPALLERPPINQSGTLFIPERLRITAMNPGILSIASYLRNKGYDVGIIDLSLEPNYESLDKKVKEIDAEVIGISSTSGFDYIESLRIASILKSKTSAPIIIGGQHVGPLGKIVLEDSEHIDAVIKYEGEWVIEQILKREREIEPLFELPGIVYRDIHKNIIETPGRPPVIPLDQLPFLDYELYPDYLRFTPFVEESRGCVYRCNYCNSNTLNNSRINIKSPDRFLDEMKKCIDIFGKDKAYAVLASTYGVNPKNGRAIAKGMKPFGIKWNSEFRADSPWEKYIYQLLESGYEVVNVGVESGSPRILELMGKTKKPNQYLEKMKKLASIVVNSDAIIRANFMFYVGETPETLKETLAFIQQSEGINSLQFSPLIAFHGTPLFNHFEEYIQKFGSQLVTTDYWKRRHIYPVHPSKYFSFEEVALLGHTLEKIFSEETAWCQAAKSLYTQETEEARKEVKKILGQSRFRRQE